MIPHEPREIKDNSRSVPQPPVSPSTVGKYSTPNITIDISQSLLAASSATHQAVLPPLKSRLRN